MTNRQNLGSVLHGSRYFILLLSILMGLIILDIYLVRINDIVNTYAFLGNDTREVLFGVISVGCLTAQFFLLKFINPIYRDPDRANSEVRVNHGSVANIIYK